MSKAYKVEVARAAERELREMAVYIARELAAPRAALNLIDTVERAILSLGTMPKRYQLTPEEPWHSSGLRRLRASNMYVYYTIVEDNATVHVVALIGTRMDQKHQLSKMSGTNGTL